MRGLVLNYRDYFKSSHKNIRVYLAIMLFATVSVAAYDVLLSIYLKHIGFTEEIVGRILSLRTMGIALGAVPMAMVAERYSKKKALKAGLIIMLFCGMAMINLKSLFMMEAAAIVFGIGHATLMVLQAPILYENSSDSHKVTAFSMAFVIQNVAMVLSSFFLGHLSGALAQQFNQTTGNLIVLNFATLLIVLPIVMTSYFSGESMTAQKNDVGTRHQNIAGYRSVLKGRALAYLLQVALVGVGAGMIVPFFSMYLKYSLEISDGVVGTIMSISQIGTIIGGLLVPAISKRFGQVKTVIICQLMSIPFLISISLPQGITLITISFFFRSSLMNMASPIIRSLSMEIIDKSERTYMSSLVSLTNNMFRAIGIYLGGIIMYTVGYNAPYYLTILCYLLGTFVIYKVFGEMEDPVTSQSQ